MKKGLSIPEKKVIINLYTRVDDADKYTWVTISETGSTFYETIKISLGV